MSLTDVKNILLINRNRQPFSMSGSLNAMRREWWFIVNTEGADFYREIYDQKCKERKHANLPHDNGSNFVEFHQPSVLNPKEHALYMFQSGKHIIGWIEYPFPTVVTRKKASYDMKVKPQCIVNPACSDTWLKGIARNSPEILSAKTFTFLDKGVLSIIYKTLRSTLGLKAQKETMMKMIEFKEEIETNWTHRIKKDQFPLVPDLLQCTPYIPVRALPLVSQSVISRK